MKNWHRAQPVQPATLAELQFLLGAFAVHLQHPPPAPVPAAQGYPATAYAARPKAAPGDRSADTDDCVRTDPVGKLTLCVNGRLHHISTGHEHAALRS